MILIQRFKKIKRQPWFKEIFFDMLFYLAVFIFGTSFIFSKIEQGSEKALILESQISSSATSAKTGAHAPEKEYLYTASSRGKYFYLIDSSRARGLSEKNKIYFKTAEEAKKLGFKPYFDS